MYLQVHTVLSSSLYEVLFRQPLHNKTMRNQLTDWTGIIASEGEDTSRCMHCPLGKRQQGTVFCQSGWSQALPAGRKQNHQDPCLYQLHSQIGALPAQMFATTWPQQHVRNSVTEAEAETEG